MKAKLEELGGKPIQQLRIKEGGRYCFAEYGNVGNTAHALRSLMTSSWRGCDLRPEIAMTQREGGGMTEVQRSSRTLYLKNISPDLTEEKMKQMFTRFGSLIRCTIPKKTDKETNYAFVEYIEPSAAEQAFKAIQDNEVFSDPECPVHVEFSKKDPTRRRLRSRVERPRRTPPFPSEEDLRKNLSFIPAFDRWTGRYVLLSPKAFKGE